MIKRLLPLCTILLCGCTAMMPYENEFACRMKDNLGKCISMQEAYDEATTGESKTKPMKPKSEQGRHYNQAPESVPVQTTPSKGSAYSTYLDSYYSELSSLVDRPVTPMVKQAKTIRVLILPYQGQGEIKTLWMERYAYAIIKEPDFIMGQYLNKKSELLQSFLQGNE